MSMTGVTPRQPPRLAVLMCFVILATGVNPAVAMGAIGRLPNSCGATAVGCRVRINRSPLNIIHWLAGRRIEN